MYQSIDSTTRGVNISFAAENTTVQRNSSGDRQSWVLSTGGSDVHAMGGIQLSFTNMMNANGGYDVVALSRRAGDEISVYTRDGFTEDGVWQKLGNLVKRTTP